MNRPAADAEQLICLLADVSRDDEGAFARLYQICSPHLYGLLLRILKRKDWAQEALQECFVKVWQKSETYDPSKGAPLTWLMAIARYSALDILRARRFEAGVIENESWLEMVAADPGQSPDHRAQVSEGLDRLDECLEQLSQEQKMSVLLTYYEGFTHYELSRAMRAPLGTVKSWVRRGLAQLRECLGV